MRSSRSWLAFVGGAAVGVLGGLIGLGGAEFRLPLLIGMFGFAALPAVIVNKATSLVVVAVALPVRAIAVPYSELLANWGAGVNLLAGSLVGAWAGASLATRLQTATLHRVLAGLLVAMGVVLFLSHRGELTGLTIDGLPQIALGVAAGFGIGIVASVMGVAGGELLIPTLILLYGLDIKVAGSMSLAVSMPTMLVGFTRYRRDQSFVVLSEHRRFVIVLAVGSAVGAITGGLLVGVVPEGVLVPTLSAILLLSSVKVWRHGSHR